MSNNSNYNYDSIIGFAKPYDFLDKEKAIFNYESYMLSRISRMMKWNNLPPTIDQRNLERMLMIGSNVYWHKVNGELYVFNGGLGGVPDVYYQPTIFTVSNPYLKYSKNCEIGKDGILMWNDSAHIGLNPMLSRYATMLTENDISMNLADIFKRINALVSASDDVTKASADEFISQIIKGKYGIIADSKLLEALKVQAFGSGNSIDELISYQQYLKASWFNELGLNANYNMKRESINSEEAQLNDDALLPLVDDMLKCRQEAIEKVNEMFGTTISVELGETWESKKEEITQMDEAQDNDPMEDQPIEEGEKQDDKEI